MEINNLVIQTSAANYDLEPHPFDFYQKWLQEKERLNYPVLVALDDNDEVLGFATYSQFRKKPGYRFCMEHSVYVRQDAHGKGIGKKLLLALEDEGRDLGMHTFIGGVDASNQGSVDFHVKLGYQIVGQLKEVGNKFDTWHDLIFVQKKL
ncbi:MAG: N-acetyltransferase family protein [Flavobacteriales bacterium]|nr:N-acetyltransferase family protein [Flavobacteriales bacterium]